MPPRGSDKQPLSVKSDFGQIGKQDLEHMFLFDGVALDHIIGLLESCQLRQLEKDQNLIVQGNICRECHLILSGSLRIHLDTPDNEPISILHSGESVGELSLIDGKPASAYVIANDQCRLITLQEHIFWSLVNASHDFARNLLFLLTRRLRDSNAAISGSIKRQHEYQRTAISDELTGLYNRRWLQDVLGRQIKRSQYNTEQLSLMMIDVDHFKRFNDNYGHLAGDQVLRAIARVMRHNVRPTDLLARYGGEEFIVVLPATDLNGARIVGNRMCASIRRTKIIDGTGNKLPTITISIGIAQMKERDSIDTFLARADEALYRAKDNGRDRVEA